MLVNLCNGILMSDNMSDSIYNKWIEGDLLGWDSVETFKACKPTLLWLSSFQYWKFKLTRRPPTGPFETRSIACLWIQVGDALVSPPVLHDTYGHVCWRTASVFSDGQWTLSFHSFYISRTVINKIKIICIYSTRKNCVTGVICNIKTFFLWNEISFFNA